jgi:WD40 repeat protein
LVLTGSWDHTARLWRVSDGKQFGPDLAHPGWVMAVAFSPDGKTLLTGGEGPDGGEARLWRVADGRPISLPLPHRNRVTAVAFSPDGKICLTAGGLGRGEARLWDVASGLSLCPPRLFEFGSIDAVAFSPDGRSALLGSSDTLLWRIPVLTERDRGRMASWAELLTGQRLDLGGAARWLDDRDLENRRRALGEMLDSSNEF